MAEFTGAKTEKDGVTIENIPTNFSGTDIHKGDEVNLGAKRNFSIWEDDADYSMNW